MAYVQTTSATTLADLQNTQAQKPSKDQVFAVYLDRLNSNEMYDIVQQAKKEHKLIQLNGRILFLTGPLTDRWIGDHNPDLLGALTNGY